MSSEDTMDMENRSGSQAPSDAATASEVDNVVAQEAPPAAGARPVRVLVSPVAATGTAVLPAAYTGVLYLQQRHEWPPMRQESEDDDDPKKMWAKWFNDMRGWLIVVAVQIASVTYQAGLDPPKGFGDKEDGESKSPKDKRYYMFFYFNTTAFVTSLAIIILLMNRSFYHSEAKVVALEIIVVLDMVGLMGAYWAGSTRKDQTTKYTLVLTALVLFTLYVVYTVQLVPTLWRLAAAAVPRRARVGAGDAAPDGNHRPADERVVLPLGVQGCGAGDHRRARHGHAHGSIPRRQHAHGHNDRVHLRARRGRARLRLRRLHGAVHVQVVGPHRRRSVGAR